MAKSVVNVVINAQVDGATQIGNLQVNLQGVQQAAERASASLAKMDFHKTITACGAFSSAMQGLVSSLDFATEGYKSFDAAMRAANTMAGSRRRQSGEREDWERARLIASVSVSPYLRKGASRDPKKIIPLPWDVKETAKEKAPAMVLTKEEADAEFNELIRARKRAT